MPFGSMKLFRVRGITLELHPAFYLLPLFIGVEGWIEDTENHWRGLAEGVGAVALVYTCVVLHEFGHALTAKKLGVEVKRIVLLPFGGVALMSHIPRSPRVELWIVIAGPLVNFVIAGLSLALLGGWPADLWDDSLPTTSMHDILEFLLLANLYLGCFNLLPAFPMDGGRILRALLARKMDYVRATKWALYIGRGVALVGIGYALFYGHYLLAALFVFILWVGKREYEQLLRDESVPEPVLEI
ncbi:MAG TPA: M50 family metallopeptidase [Opitutales bacterium]|jgi:Zn-dependent protease|nr:M50 family metallopeptidase [Opitutales bacterium]